MSWNHSGARPAVSKSGSKDFAGQARLDAIFEEFDTDGSGAISAYELRLSLKARFNLDLDHDNALLLVSRFDIDCDGEISKDEFKSIMEMCLRMKRNFDRSDLDGSNAIDVKEMQQLAKQIGINLNQESTQALVDIFDEDHSGEIEYQEFFNLALFTRELEHQYESNVQVGNVTSEVIKLVLGPAAKSDRSLSSFLAKNPKCSFDEFVVAVVTALKATRNRYKAPRVLKVRAPRKKAPKKKDSLLSKMSRNFAGLKLPSMGMTKYSRDNQFVDNAFPPSAKILGKHASKVVSWRRPCEMSDQPELFIDGVEEGDVIQGSLGNCWFLGAIAVVASYGTAFIEQSFDRSDFQGGHHVCKFFKNGEWVAVEVDDRLPCGADGRPAFASSRDDDEFWVAIMEKAYAKLHGGYHTLDSGTISYGLRDLTGEPVEQVRLDEPETLPCGPSIDEQWFMFENNIKESFLMGCEITSAVAMPEEKNAFGLLLNHAYSIIDCQTIEGNRLVRLRNPWGNYEWTGPWSDGAPEWTPQLLKHFGDYDFDNDGTFFMEFSDFANFFNSIHVLRLLTDDVGEVWTKYRVNGVWSKEANTAGGCMMHKSWPTNPQFRIIAPQPNTRVFMCLSQEDRRYQGKQNAKLPGIGFDILRGDGNVRNGYKKAHAGAADTVKQSLFLSSRDNSVEFLANPTKQPEECYSVIPSTFDANVESKFVLTVYTQHPCTVEELQAGNAGPGAASGAGAAPGGVQGRWEGKSAGGCMNFPSWLNNPQFVFTVGQPGDVTITMQQDDSGEPPATVGMYLFDGAKFKGNRINSAAARPVFKTQFINLPEISTAVKITEANHPYIVMPCTFNDKVTRSFNLYVTCNTSQVSLKEASDMPSVGLEGQWAGKLVGGCMNHGTWKSNPRYALTLQSAADVEIFLGRTEPMDGAFGFYVFKDKRNNGVPDVMTIEGNSKFTKLENLSKVFSLEAGRYILLPCTMDPKVKGKFRIAILGDNAKSMVLSLL